MPYRDTKRSRDERLGEAFRLNDQFENLLTMTAERRETILAGSPTVRISYGHYVVARSAALELNKERAR